MKKFLYLLGTLLLLSSCMDDKALLADLDHAETVMEEHPDSAYMLLVAHDSLMVSQQSRNTRMRYQLLMTEALNKLYQPLPTDSLFQLVVDYYDDHGTPNQQLKAHYLLGCIHRDRGEAPQALQCYYDAVEKADTLKDDCDYYTLISVYGQMAELYDAQYMPDEEIEVLKKVQYYAIKSGDTFTYIKGKELLCRPYAMLRDTTRVFEIAATAGRLYKKYGFLQEVSNAYSHVISIYIGRKQYEKAYELIQKLEKESYIFDEGYPDKTRQRAYNFLKGQYYHGTDQLELADSIYRTLLGTEYEFEAYDGLLSVFLKSESSDSIIKYWSLYDNAFKEKYTTLYTKSMHKVAALYNYTRNQRIAQEKESEANRKSLIIALLIFAFMLVFIIVYWQYRKFKINKLREIARLNTNYITTKLNYEKVQNELLHIKDDFVGSLQEKQQDLEHLKQRLLDLQKQYANLTSSEKEESLMHSDIIIAFQEMAKPKLHQMRPSLSDWENLYAIVKQCRPLFYAVITKDSILSKQELQTSVLSFLNFPSGDIAVLLDTTVQRITNVKAIANKKLFSENGATSFVKNLKNL